MPRCPTCGATVTVAHGDDPREKTRYYVPTAERVVDAANRYTGLLLMDTGGLSGDQLDRRRVGITANLEELVDALAAHREVENG